MQTKNILLTTAICFTGRKHFNNYHFCLTGLFLTLTTSRPVPENHPIPMTTVWVSPQ